MCSGSHRLAIPTLDGWLESAVITLAESFNNETAFNNVFDKTFLNNATISLDGKDIPTHEYKPELWDFISGHFSDHGPPVMSLTDSNKVLDPDFGEMVSSLCDSVRSYRIFIDCYPARLVW